MDRIFISVHLLDFCSYAIILSANNDNCSLLTPMDLITHKSSSCGSRSLGFKS